MREFVLMLNPWGAAVIVRLQSGASPALVAFFLAMTHLGDGYYVLLALALYWCLDRRRSMQLVTLYAFSLALNAGIKVLFASPRPFEAFPEVIARVSASGYSFPSGHAQLAAAFGGGIAWLYRRPWATAMAIALALVIAMSRVWLGVHYPHDVAAGLLLGLATVLVWMTVPRWLTRGGLSPGWHASASLAALLAVGLLALLDGDYAHLASGAWVGFVTGYLIAERCLTRPGGRRGGQWVRAGVGFTIVLASAVAIASVADWREHLISEKPTGAAVATLLGLALALFAPWAAQRLEARMLRRDAAT